MFQSRYRAASHFRSPRLELTGTNLMEFQSRYRAASHFRNITESQTYSLDLSFNLVIERLLISGGYWTVPVRIGHEFQSRYRAASHFRLGQGL